MVSMHVLHVSWTMVMRDNGVWRLCCLVRVESAGGPTGVPLYWKVECDQRSVSTGVWSASLMGRDTCPYSDNQPRQWSLGALAPCLDWYGLVVEKVGRCSTTLSREPGEEFCLCVGPFEVAGYRNRREMNSKAESGYWIVVPNVGRKR